MPEQPVWSSNERVVLSYRWKGKPAAARRPVSDINVQDTVSNNFTERSLIQAYLKLFLVPAGDDGTKTITLARLGPYEMRLIEFSPDASGSHFPVWLELYAHDARCTVDSCGCCELDEAVAIAEEFISHARRLYLPFS
jgi:hypothetical protein